jgi:hypothetical protein
MTGDLERLLPVLEKLLSWEFWSVTAKMKLAMLEEGISFARFKPLFGKACPEHSRREGKGRFLHKIVAIYG